MTETPIFLLVFDTHQRKWAKKRISGLLMNENFRIFFELNSLQHVCKFNRIKGKNNFRIVGANFCKKLHLAVSLRIIQF